MGGPCRSLKCYRRFPAAELASDHSVLMKVAERTSGPTQTAVSTKDPSRLPLLPAPIKRRGEALLNQQCWTWGRDVRRAEGNLLVNYGFEQFRRPDDACGGTAYRLELTDDSSSPRSLTLWGFGFYFASAAQTGGIFMNRFNFTPELSETLQLDLPLWHFDQLPLRYSPRNENEARRALYLLAEACMVVEGYEGIFAQTD